MSDGLVTELLSATRVLLQSISDNSQWLCSNAAYQRICDAADPVWDVVEKIKDEESKAKEDIDLVSFAKSLCMGPWGR